MLRKNGIFDLTVDGENQFIGHAGVSDRINTVLARPRRTIRTAFGSPALSQSCLKRQIRALQMPMKRVTAMMLPVLRHRVMVVKMYRRQAGHKRLISFYANIADIFIFCVRQIFVYFVLD